MQSTSSSRRPLGLFFFLVVTLSIPFWLFGNGQLPLLVKLPVSALEFLIPVTAASILLFRQEGFPGVRRLFGRTFDFRRIQNRAWYLPIVLLNPLVFFLSFVILRLTGTPLPGTTMPWMEVPIYMDNTQSRSVGWASSSIVPSGKVQNRPVNRPNPRANS